MERVHLSLHFARRLEAPSRGSSRFAASCGMSPPGRRLSSAAMSFHRHLGAKLFPQRLQRIKSMEPALNFVERGFAVSAPRSASIEPRDCPVRVHATLSQTVDGDAGCPLTMRAFTQFHEQDCFELRDALQSFGHIWHLRHCHVDNDRYAINRALNLTRARGRLVKKLLF
jgi:hypothetical protein